MLRLGVSAARLPVRRMAREPWPAAARAAVRPPAVSTRARPWQAPLPLRAGAGRAAAPSTRIFGTRAATQGGATRAGLRRGPGMACRGIHVGPPFPPSGRPPWQRFLIIAGGVIIASGVIFMGAFVFVAALVLVGGYVAWRLLGARLQRSTHLLSRALRQFVRREGESVPDSLVRGAKDAFATFRSSAEGAADFAAAVSSNSPAPAVYRHSTAFLRREPRVQSLFGNSIRVGWPTRVEEDVRSDTGVHVALDYPIQGVHPPSQRPIRGSISAVAYGASPDDFELMADPDSAEFEYSSITMTVFSPRDDGSAERKRGSPHFLFDDSDDSDEDDELPPHTTVDLTDRVTTGHVREAHYRDV